MRYLRPDAVQFCGFRVSTTTDDEPTQAATAVKVEEGDDWQKPFSTGKSVFLCWIGEDVRVSAHNHTSTSAIQKQ